ncbi:uncharacterized protein BCR38DRAFT_409662 [Pseudomassariella vexata]|uniref:Indole-diterpene biosynthesis protein PaxU n=1 Tax=Pseudomassariella vexata TaxID=1141098 RepID=A0A1Y2DYA5_9PEZI|nr:uncharacterized protein BCR38DRAFT_409662 [Pseudomassariella vexata]ORY64282.1 hypothetical protein BCR38DRAFT_409662 [Pseudomassariella vexata]
MTSNQAAIAAVEPLGTMTKLSPFVFFYEPTSAKSSTGNNTLAPKLILVAAWMDARDVHIAKYITRYQTLYPSSTILLVKFVLKQIIWESEAVKLVQPAVSYLQAQVNSGHLAASPGKPEMLVHVFSNGGIASTKHLFDLYRQNTGRAFPLHATVYDSCPGLYDFRGAYEASMAGVKGFWRWIMAPIIFLLDVCLWVNAVVLRRPYSLLVNADFHNNPKQVRQTNRSYIFGKKDQMVNWKHIELHAKEAEANRFNVRLELFPNGSHVTHVRVNETRYWLIVRETWEKARRN